MFKDLFDGSFEKFVTLSLAKYIMFLSYALSTLFWVLMILGNLSSPMMGGGAKFFMIIFGIIGWFVSLIFIRIWLEFSIALIKTSEEASRIRKVLEEKGNS